MNNNINIELSNKVMRRIYIVSYLRRLLSPVAVKSYIALGLVWILTRMVFISAVIQNAPEVSSPWAFVNFMLQAFLHTQFLVQAVLLGTLGLLAWGITDLVTRGKQALFSPAF